ncbi:MAG: hypothetical protein QW112_00870, partial [Candidatus Micrarchaeia archaeon]
MNIIKLNAIRPVLNRIRTGQAPVKNYFDSEKGRALAESIQKNVEYFEKDIRSQGKWISLLFDTEKINRLDPEETFRFFAFTTLFQGGDIGTIGN